MNQAASARVHRHLPAGPERVFDAWLDPDVIAMWMFPDDEIVRITIDPQVRGTFTFVVRRDGQEVKHRGEYLEIARPERLVFTWSVDDEEGADRVEVEIVPSADGSELTLTHTMHPDWADFVDRTQAAWASMLDALVTTFTDQ